MLNRPVAHLPLRIVFDTNVLLSLWVFADSRYAALRSQVETGRAIMLASPATLAEFKRVLGYAEFSLEADRQTDVYEQYLRAAESVFDRPAARIPLPVCSDRDDQKFLELARDGGAHWLVTQDKALLKLARRRPLMDHFRILTADAALAAPAMSGA